MPRPISEKCRRCAKQAVAIAQEKDCWEGQKCHVRRSNYKKREFRNRQRRQHYRINQGATPAEAEVLSAAGEKTPIQVLTIPVPESVAAVIHLYRQNKTAPLHAIAAELLRNGEKVVMVEPVHTLGWTTAQVKAYMRDILRAFSKHVGQELVTYEAQVEHHPETCQIPDCPLHGVSLDDSA